MSKSRLWIATLLMAVLVLSACAPVAPDSGSAAPADEAAADESMDETMAEGEMMDWEGVDPSGQTVVFWYQHSDEREEALQQIIQEFNDTNEYGITVEGEYQGGYGDIFTKMLNVLNTSDAPNLVVAYQNQAATYQLADSLVDMTSLVESERWGLSAEDQADFFPGFFNADVFPSFNNERLGFPPNRSMEVLYYNQSWLEELGYDGAPTTPDEFMEMACAAVETPYSAAVGDVGSMGYQVSIDASRFASWTFGFGGDIFDYDANEFTLNSEASVQAMQFLQDLFSNGCAAEVAESYGDQTDFGNGNLLFTVGSSSGLPFYASVVEEGAAFDWSVAAIPHVTDDPVQNVYGASVSMPKSTPEAELATWLFIEYYTSPSVQATWAEASQYFPVRESVANEMGDYFAADPAYETAFELLEYGVTEPPVPGYDFVRDEMETTMAAIINGAEVQSSLDELNTTANEILADQMADMQ